MIQNDIELQATQERIVRFQQQLAHLRKAETNATAFRLSASGFIAEIDRMQLDVREYLSLHPSDLKKAEGLLSSSNDVVVIPARHGWPLYKKYGIHAYICQEGRAFQPVKYIAFYERKQIHPVIPLILEQHDHVAIERGKHVGRLGELVDRYLVLLERPDLPYQAPVGKVFLLSAPDAAETVKLAQPVINDQKSENGTRTAYTMCQRYVSLEALRRAKKTSELCDK